MTTAKPASTSLEMKENQSIDDVGMGTTRLVTKQDGTKEPFNQATLQQSLEQQLEGLNQEYINLEIILAKVSSGLYNGKYSYWQLPENH